MVLMDPVLRFDGVGLRYGQGPEVLRDIDMTLERGGFRFLTGESGAGKSSLLRLMYLAARPSRGRVMLFGEDTGQVARDRMPGGF